MSTTNPEIQPAESEGFQITDPAAFDEYSDRELLQFLAARFTDITNVVINVGEQAPEAFAKFANPMVQLAMKSALRMFDR